MKRVLVIAAHPDDEVLGAGATMARLASEGAEVHVAIVTEGCSAQYPDRPDLIAVKQAQARTALAILGGREVHFGGLPDMRLDTVSLLEVNRFLEDVVETLAPDLVFTHHADDLNRDHRVVHEASLVACRSNARRPIRTLYAYDVLGVTNFGGIVSSFTPNTFFEAERYAGHKTRALEAYEIEVRPFPHPRSAQGLDAQGRMYGVLSGTRWAEAFQVLRDTR